MTYEEKLIIVVNAIREARKATRKERATNLHITKENGLKDIDLHELHDILLQLQDDKEVITIHDIPTKMKPVTEQTNDILSGHKNHFIIDVLKRFDNWYSSFLLKEKTKLENLSKTNFDNIAYLMSLIEQELEIFQSKKIIINFIYAVSEIEGYDSDDIDHIIRTYTRGLSYLEEIGVVRNFTSGSKTLSSEITLDIPKFFEVLEKMNTLQQKASTKKVSKPKREDNRKDKRYEEKEKTEWPKDFRWEGNKFVFGKYGQMSFKSRDRKHILKALTGKKGGWATIKELRGSKDANYVRSTIKQIKNRFSSEVKKHINIVSTQEDSSSEKPSEGAYRIILS